MMSTTIVTTATHQIQSGHPHDTDDGEKEEEHEHEQEQEQSQEDEQEYSLYPQVVQENENGQLILVFDPQEAWEKRRQAWLNKHKHKRTKFPPSHPSSPTHSPTTITSYEQDRDNKLSSNTVTQTSPSPPPPTKPTHTKKFSLSSVWKDFPKFNSMSLIMSNNSNNSNNSSIVHHQPNGNDTNDPYQEIQRLLLNSDNLKNKDKAKLDYVLRRIHNGHPVKPSMPLPILTKLLYRSWLSDGTIQPEWLLNKDKDDNNNNNNNNNND